MDSLISELEESAALKLKLKDDVGTITKIGEAMIHALAQGGKVVLFGNGGSAADAQHLAAELVGRFRVDRRSLPAIALTTDTSILTAVANDWAFEEVFARQVQSIVGEGDLVIGISTSGNSKNVLRGIEEAKAKGAKTVGLSGRGGGALSKLVDISLVVPSDSTPRIQEAHITIGHLLCGMTERYFVSNR